MDLTQLIKHPEMMDKETLYDLRGYVALYPYHQTARLLLLQNLYLLHDPTFDEELRRTAIYITDRRKIFELVEAAHYHIKPLATTTQKPADDDAGDTKKEKRSRTVALIDSFLEQMPTDSDEAQNSSGKKRKPTPADAAVDYVAYLLETEGEDEKTNKEEQPLLKGQNLIDNFLINEGGNFDLKDNPEYVPAEEETDSETETEGDDGYFTETLARIYIKQGRYSKALEIIKRLNLIYPKKNSYFADQIRFLEKLLLNNSSQNGDKQS